MGVPARAPWRAGVAPCGGALAPAPTTSGGADRRERLRARRGAPYAAESKSWSPQNCGTSWRTATVETTPRARRSVNAPSPRRVSGHTVPASPGRSTTARSPRAGTITGAFVMFRTVTGVIGRSLLARCAGLQMREADGLILGQGRGSPKGGERPSGPRLFGVGWHPRDVRLHTRPPLRPAPRVCGGCGNGVKDV